MTACLYRVEPAEYLSPQSRKNNWDALSGELQVVESDKMLRRLSDGSEEAGNLEEPGGPDSSRGRIAHEARPPKNPFSAGGPIGLLGPLEPGEPVGLTRRRLKTGGSNYPELPRRER